MGELTGSDNYVDGHQAQAASDLSIKGEPGKVATEVPGVFASGEKLGAPVFSVDHDEFHQNMEFGRKRLRFKDGSPVQQYMQKAQVNRPFWLSYQDPNNKEVWTRKVK